MADINRVMNDYIALQNKIAFAESVSCETEQKTGDDYKLIWTTEETE